MRLQGPATERAQYSGASKGLIRYAAVSLDLRCGGGREYTTGITAQVNRGCTVLAGHQSNNS